MKQISIAIPFILMCTAQITHAEPCVSATFDKPLEGASSVITRQVDVPSPQFPGLWQEGILNGYFYAIYANGEAELKAVLEPQEWTLKVNCTADAEGCAKSQTGTPPPEANATLAILEQCLGGAVVPQAPEAPNVTEVAEVAEVVKAPCGLQTVAEGADGEVLQNLIVAAGKDPGPVDGIIGAKTLDALVEILGPSSRSLGVREAVTALDAFLCDAAD